VASRFAADGRGLDDLTELLAEADVVVAATSAPGPVVTRRHVESATSSRPDRPLVLVDLAVPADVDRDAGAIAGVRLFDVDDLRAGLDESVAARLREVPAVEAIIEEEVAEFARRQRELEVEPVVAELRRRAEAIRTRELDRALRDLGEVDARVAERVDHLSRTLVKRLLHDPTVRLRERASAGNADEAAEAARDLFGIAPPRP
jgi:glutamyl-tRNA reductase